MYAYIDSKQYMTYIMKNASNGIQVTICDFLKEVGTCKIIEDRDITVDDLRVNICGGFVKIPQGTCIKYNLTNDLCSAFRNMTVYDA